jgi:hypothetical protein
VPQVVKLINEVVLKIVL